MKRVKSPCEVLSSVVGEHSLSGGGALCRRAPGLCPGRHSGKRTGEELFHRHIPRRLVVDDLSVLEGYYRGDATFYTSENLRA